MKNKYINYIPSLRRRHSSSLNVFMPLGKGSDCNFAAFMGTQNQRTQVAVQGMMQAAERNKGIIYLHGGQSHCCDVLDIFSLRYEGLFGRKPVVREPNPIGTTQCYYDPLYGQDKTGALNCILAASGNGPSTLGTSGVRSRIEDLLTISEHIARLVPDLFGNHPYNLDFLLKLSSMNFDEIRKLILPSLPIGLSEQLSRNLNDSSSLDAARNTIRDYSSHMRCRLWKPRRFQDHTKISIVSAVEKHEVIAIHMPGGNNPLANCVDAELDVLIQRGIPFLLIADSVSIENSKLRARFMDDHLGSVYTTGILSETAAGIVGDAHENVGQIMSSTEHVILFAAANAAVAEPFSAIFGTYYRMVEEKNHGRRRGFWDIFPDINHGKNCREHEERCVRPYDLISLRNGALLCGRSELPTLVKSFIL